MPKEVLDMVRKIVYGFIWEGPKGIRWRQMTKLKANSYLGLKDPRMKVVEASILRVACV